MEICGGLAELGGDCASERLLSKDKGQGSGEGETDENGKGADSRGIECDNECDQVGEVEERCDERGECGEDDDGREHPADDVFDKCGANVDVFFKTFTDADGVHAERVSCFGFGAVSVLNADDGDFVSMLGQGVGFFEDASVVADGVEHDGDDMRGVLLRVHGGSVHAICGPPKGWGQ